MNATTLQLVIFLKKNTHFYSLNYQQIKKSYFLEKTSNYYFIWCFLFTNTKRNFLGVKTSRATCIGVGKLPSLFGPSLTGGCLHITAIQKKVYTLF